MKKAIVLLLAMAMTLALASCNESGAGTTPGGENSPAPSAAMPTASPAPASPAPASPAGDGGFTPIDCEPLTIRFSTVFNEIETGGEIVHQWIDYLSQYSNGAITVDPYWGGTLYGDVDVLDGLSMGAIDMTTFGHMPHIGTLNYLGFPSFAPGGTEAALDFFSTIMFENPETSALVQQEAADSGIIFLNVLPGGANAFCTTYEFSDLATLVSGSKSFGNIDAAVFESLGFQVTAIGPGEGYDALNRGLIDSTQMSLTPMVSMQWYDVAPYWALDGTYTAGNFMTANLDWWNGLTADQQAVIQAASDAVQQWSMVKYDTEINNDLATIEEATGNPIIQFPQADIDAIWAANFDAKASAALAMAAPNGKTDGMVKILELAAELTGYDWTYEG